MHSASRYSGDEASLWPGNDLGRMYCNGPRSPGFNHTEGRPVPNLCTSNQPVRKYLSPHRK